MKIASLICILVFFASISTQAQAVEYACEADPVNLEEGDVLSSETLNDIVKRINNNMVGFSSQAELNGTWSCLSILSDGVGKSNENNPGQGFAKDENGVWTSTNTIVFEYETDETSKVIFENLLWSNTSDVWPVQTCIARVIGPNIWMYHYDPDVIVWNSPGSCQVFNYVWQYTKRSDTCFTFDANNSPVNVICNKQNVPPDAPLTLAASVILTSSQASLAWASGDSSTTGYDVQRKTSIDGAFSSIATTTETSYLDTIAINNTYWYRIFATNANGTGRGSNVKKVTFSNTPPSINMASVLSINEGNTSITTITASDIEADRITNPQTLTYSIASLAPGNDASAMSINASTGLLAFNSAPDYESPADYDTNNIYSLILTVTDGTDSVSQDFSVAVLNVSD